MELTREEIDHLAQLARLDFSEEEVQQFRGQLASILSYVEMLNEVETAEVEPVTTVLPQVNVFLKDEVRNPLPKEDFLQLSPSSDHGHYKVPKVIE